jgi:hypothetical protein
MDANMDKIFYPDRSASEAARLNQERAEFFEITVRRRSTDRIFWPDLDDDEALELRRAGEQFFETAVRKK